MSDALTSQLERCHLLTSGIAEELRQLPGRREFSVGDVELTFLCFGDIPVQLSNKTEESGTQEKGVGWEYKCENV